MTENGTEHKSPWTTIWYDPRGTIRYLVEHNPMQSFVLLIALGGVGNVLSYASSYGLADMIPFNQMIVFSFIAGPIGAFISLYLWSWFLGITTHLWGGQATKQGIRTSIAWSMAPVVYMLPLWGVKYILFRQELFSAEKPFMNAHEFLSGLAGLFEVIDVLISLFSFYILINAIAEVSGFSFWRSIGSIGAVILILTVPALFLIRFLMPM